jgi:hypothetical protein
VVRLQAPSSTCKVPPTFVLGHLEWTCTTSTTAAPFYSPAWLSTSGSALPTLLRRLGQGDSGPPTDTVTILSATRIRVRRQPFSRLSLGPVNVHQSGIADARCPPSRCHRCGIGTESRGLAIIVVSGRWCGSSPAFRSHFSTGKQDSNSTLLPDALDRTPCAEDGGRLSAGEDSHRKPPAQQARAIIAQETLCAWRICTSTGNNHTLRLAHRRNRQFAGRSPRNGKHAPELLPVWEA